MTGMNEPIASPNLIAVDIGNSRIKLGEFPNACGSLNHLSLLPEPAKTLECATRNDAGEIDLTQLSGWLEEHVSDRTKWWVASVQRVVAKHLNEILAGKAKRLGIDLSVRQLTYRDVPLAVSIDQPERVGIDRLLGALAADRLRQRDRAAIIVDLGTAITVDLLQADGAFAGGAILPGIGMSARALAEQTDALPQVDVTRQEIAPPALGKSTETAIQAGLYWGALGAIRELILRLSSGLWQHPQVFVTGGAGQRVAAALSQERPVQHVPHLVLAGIALVGARIPGEAGG
jgi:type III pantothenate kinase